jgi:hypothetical protein
MLRILLDTSFSYRVKRTNLDGNERGWDEVGKSCPWQKELIRSDTIIPREVDRSSAVWSRAWGIVSAMEKGCIKR